MKNNYSLTTELFSGSAPADSSIGQNYRGRLGWLLSLLFTCQSLISLGQVGTTVAGGNNPGSNANQLNNPAGIYVTANGVVYVADYDNHRVQKWAVGATSGVTVAGGNGTGTSGTQLNHPFGVYVDAAGTVYVADAGNHRIQKWTAGATSGVTVAGGNGIGTDLTHLNAPTGIYVKTDGTLYVADFLNNRVQKFAPGSTSATAGETVAGGNGEGAAANQLRHPEGVVVDESTNTVYVADTYNHRVQKWTAGATAGVTVAGNTAPGAGASQLNTVFALYRDSNGDIYVADGYNHRIQKFPSGSTVGETVAGGHGPGADVEQINTPEGVFLDDNKRIYVADHANHRIQRYGSCAAPIATLSNSGTLTCRNTTVTLTAGGGSAGNTYTFSNGATPDGSPTGNTATVTQEGTYTVTVTNTLNGCTSTTTTQVQSYTAPPSATLTNTGPISDNNQTVTLTATGDGTYVFSNGATQQGNSGTATVTSPGPYSVTVTRSDNGCSGGASTTVTGAKNQTTCRNGTAILTVVASGTPLKYEWYRNSPGSARLTEMPNFQRGTNTASLSLINQQTTANYYAKVTDQDGSVVIYGPAKVTVNLSCNSMGRLAAEEVGLKITVMGNPVSGEQLRAVVAGAAGRSLTVQLLDLSGRSVHQQQWQQAGSDQQVDWNMNGQPGGVYLLQAVSGADADTPAQRHTLKVIKP